MPNDFKYDVFLSHSHKDKPVVRELANRLKKDKLRVWFDEQELKPGDNIPMNCTGGTNSFELNGCKSFHSNLNQRSWTQGSFK